MDAIKVKKLREGAVIPTYGSQAAAGADLFRACFSAVCAPEVPAPCAV